MDAPTLAAIMVQANAQGPLEQVVDHVTQQEITNFLNGANNDALMQDSRVRYENAMSGGQNTYPFNFTWHHFTLGWW